MERKNKAETYIGFAVRSGKYKTGANACATLKRARLVIVCRTAGENTRKEAKKLAERFACPLLETKEVTLEELSHRPNAKVMAITEANLAAALCGLKDKDFIEREQE